MVLCFPYTETFVESIQLMDQTLLIGAEGSLTCSVTLNEPLGVDTSSLSVTWYHDNSTIITTDSTGYITTLERQSDVMFNSILTILTVTETDGGVYRCSAAIEGIRMKTVESFICVEGII